MGSAAALCVSWAAQYIKHLSLLQPYCRRWCEDALLVRTRFSSGTLIIPIRSNRKFNNLSCFLCAYTNKRQDFP